MERKSNDQRWSPRERIWPRGHPRGHNLKSLALVSKPGSPQKCPVLGLRTSLFFDWLKMGQGHDHFCFSSLCTPETRGNFMKTFFSENA